MNVGEVIAANGFIEINVGKKAIQLEVTNAGDRPIQIGSHFHFFEANEHLKFDRNSAYGYRLDIPSGTAVRFQPSEVKTVGLVEIGGKRKVMGANGKINGLLDERKADVIGFSSVKK